MGGDSTSTPHSAQQEKEQEKHDEHEWVDVDSDEDTVCTNEQQYS